MKKPIAILIAATMLCSCASLRYKDYRPVTDYREQMELVRINFPEVYEMYKDGEVIIDEVFEYTDRKTGGEKVHISYHYRNGRRY